MALRIPPLGPLRATDEEFAAVFEVLLLGFPRLVGFVFAADLLATLVVVGRGRGQPPETGRAVDSPLSRRRWVSETSSAQDLRRGDVWVGATAHRAPALPNLSVHLSFPGCSAALRGRGKGFRPAIS